MKKRYIVIIVFVGIMLGYIFMTPFGALRFSVLTSGNLKSAVKMDAIQIPSGYDKKANMTKYVFLKNEPVDNGSGNPMFTWAVYKYGIFYIGEYFGEA